TEHEVADAAPDREVDLEVVESKELGHAEIGLDGAGADAAGADTVSMSDVGKRWQATRTPSENRTSGGTTSVHTFIANSQRGAKRQPGGGVSRSGGWPGMTSSVRRSALMFGNDPTSLRV